MKKKCFSVEQIVSVRKQAEPGTPVADPIRKIGVDEHQRSGGAAGDFLSGPGHAR